MEYIGKVLFIPVIVIREFKEAVNSAQNDHFGLYRASMSLWFGRKGVDPAGAGVLGSRMKLQKVAYEYK